MQQGSGQAYEFGGGAPAVLLVHGFTGTPWEVRPIADALQHTGFAVHAPLLPGHGLTPEALSATTWADWIAATDAATEALVRSHRRVVLLGMSLGALLVLDTAVRLQNSGVVGCVTLGCPLRFSTFSDGVLAVAHLLGDRMPHTFIPKKGGGSDVQDLEMKHANPAYRTQPLRAAREFVTGQRVVRRALPSLRVPLLAMHGLLDATAPLGSSIELVGLAGSVDSSLIVLPHSGHLIGVDRDKTEVARQVCAFTKRVGVAGASTA